MIIDANLEVSSAQALTATALSTSQIDLTQTARQVGVGTPMWFNMNVVVAADFTTGDETYSFAVETDSDVGFATANVKLAERAILAATLVVGFKWSMMIPTENVKRYLAMRYTLAGTTPLLTIDAHLSSFPIDSSLTSQPDALAKI